MSSSNCLTEVFVHSFGLTCEVEQVPQVLEVDVESALMGHGGCRHHVSRARQQREWFHIGGFLMDTSKLALPPWMPVLDDGPEMSIGVIGSCLLTNVRSGIWIVGRTTLS